MSGSRWVALGVLCLSLLTIVVDNTIVNVALPTLVRELDADVSELQWVVDAYTLVFAGLLLLAGALGDRYGRRRTLLAGLAVFAASSAAAASAGERGGPHRLARGDGRGRRLHHARDAVAAHQRVPRRARAGDGGRHLGGDRRARRRPRPGRRRVPARQLLVGLDLPGQRPALRGGDRRRAPGDPRVPQRGRRAPRLGRRGAVRRRVDRAGVRGHRGAGRRAGPPRRSSPRAVIALVLLGGFVRRQRRIAEPLLDLSLFRNPRFSAASTAVMVLFFALFGFLFLSTQYLQFVLGFSPFEAGIRVLPYAVAMIVFASLSGRLVRGFGTRRVATLGMLLFAGGARRRRDRRDGHRLRTPGRRLRDHGRRHGPRGRARDRVDHELTAGCAGQHRLRGERHDSRARRRARRRRRRQRDVGALREPAARRRPRRRPRLARRGGPTSATSSGTARARRSSTRCRRRRSRSPPWPRSAR